MSRSCISSRLEVRLNVGVTSSQRPSHVSLLYFNLTFAKWFDDEGKSENIYRNKTIIIIIIIIIVIIIMIIIIIIITIIISIIIIIIISIIIIIISSCCCYFQLYILVSHVLNAVRYIMFYSFALCFFPTCSLIYKKKQY